LHCFAGCEFTTIIEALEGKEFTKSHHTRRSTATFAGRIVKTYDYVEESGELLYQVVRYEPKDFKQRRPDSRGGWIWKKGERQVLYRIREVLESPIVFVVEGERDADTLLSRGFVATTNAGGAKAPWLPEYTDVLRGREIILIPDNDPAGWGRVTRIARALVGKVARLVILELEDAKDITEWFHRGHSDRDLIAELERKEVSK
jgi:putative DNA primase/helicase